MSLHTTHIEWHKLLGIPPQIAVNCVAPLSIKQIKRAVAAYYWIPLADIESKERHKKIVRARRIAMYLAKELTGLTYPAIARRFDRRSTTVLRGIRIIEQLRTKDSLLDLELTSFEFAFRNLCEVDG
ncbi:MAG TPA: helix-turn-helix domain-containing protein [Bryobacteraceae bacterium]|nr:helix-turn-helix domain-containing protein [Bryobacteraceae bacterium]